MQTFIAEINVMPHKALLDPQGKAVMGGMNRLKLSNVHDARIGKRIELTIEAESEEAAHAAAEKACKNLLVNAVMEYFEIHISPLAEAY